MSITHASKKATVLMRRGCYYAAKEKADLKVRLYVRIWRVRKDPPYTAR